MVLSARTPTASGGAAGAPCAHSGATTARSLPLPPPGDGQPGFLQSLSPKDDLGLRVLLTLRWDIKVVFYEWSIQDCAILQSSCLVFFCKPSIWGTQVSADRFFAA